MHGLTLTTVDEHPMALTSTTFNQREQKDCLVFELLFCEFIVSQSLRSYHRFTTVLNMQNLFFSLWFIFHLVSVKVMRMN